MGCVHSRSKTFVTFSYQNSEEGLSTNNHSSTTLGFNNDQPGKDFNELNLHRSKMHDLYSNPSPVIVELKGSSKSKRSKTVQNDGYYKKSSCPEISKCSAVGMKKRREFFYRSKSEDQRQFHEIVSVPEPTRVLPNFKFLKHHRSDNQLQAVEETFSNMNSRRQSFI